MKAWKYGLTLFLGLSVCGFGTRAFAQASGQTAEVVPTTATPLPDVPAAKQLKTQEQSQEQPQRGVPTPKVIETLVDKGEYAKAVEEFEKFIKTAKGNPCDLIYLPFTFYDRLRMEDTSKTSFYQEKTNFYLDNFFKTCGNTVDGYLLRASLGERNPDSIIVWMTKAMQIEQDYVMLYTMRGDALWELQHTKEACADFKKAAELNDEYSINFYNMNCVETGQQETAPVQVQ